MLDATPKEITVERKTLRINPAKTCQPVGAMYAALGIHNCLPHSHGSQGCCSYHRTVLSRHFKEPAMATTSSFTEGASVFGGGSNIKTAVKNIFSLYNPDIIAVHTTCLSETLGDDLPTYISQMEDAGSIPEGKLVIHTNTPSYVGSHITGFSNMVEGMVKYLAENTDKKNGKINIIPGFVGPADMREIKRLFEAMDIPYTMFPDTSGVLDCPTTGEFKMYPDGGAKIEDIVDSGNSDLTLALGAYASELGAKTLEKKCKVPFKTLKTPIGVAATDDLLMAMSEATGKEVPASIEEERGQLIDLMIDSQQYLQGKKVALIGDPDEIIALSKFIIELGAIPKYVVTGTPGAKFAKAINPMLEEAGIEGSTVKAEGDFFDIHQWIKNEGVDLLISNTYGKFIAREENIPFVRFGFPVMDRYGHIYNPKVGYKGAIQLTREIVDVILDKIERECTEEDFEVVR
ncbi:nitrogenase molybdenum-iron protein subunit beta [Clostridium sp.]|jgi:nitrogenase molybdenum-iron protein beta chain|uniref:nitrogenase molybdenum-iron protein subunit beta n=1 Tax=Clostridium sp. TaxID=1506 RepID=UPI00258E2556|nr:nitrogenase molybdenum-iron protein subunit beta [Clostridium sp.]MDF2504636.1 nitrogenase molybdenum-iron protein beta chain [Clostridium sp.]